MGVISARPTLIILLLSCFVQRCYSQGFFNITCDNSTGRIYVTLTNTTLTGGALYTNSDPLCNGTNSLVVDVGTCNGALPYKGATLNVTYQSIASVYRHTDIHGELKCTEEAFKGTITVNMARPVTVRPDNFTAVTKRGSIGTANIGSLTLTFVNPATNTIVTSASVGQTIRLRVQLDTSDILHKIVPVTCTAKATQPLSIDLVKNRCPMHDLSVEYATSNSNQTDVSHNFKVFGLGIGIPNAQSVSFECVVQFCGRLDNSEVCLLKTSANCTRLGRRKRAALSDNQGTATITSQLTVAPKAPTLEGETSILVIVIGSSAGAIFVVLSAIFIVLAARKKATNVNLALIGKRPGSRPESIGATNSAFSPS